MISQWYQGLGRLDPMGVVFCQGIDWIKLGEERCTLSWEVEELGVSTRGFFGSKEVRSPTPIFRE